VSRSEPEGSQEFVIGKNVATEATAPLPFVLRA